MPGKKSVKTVQNTLFPNNLSSDSIVDNIIKAGKDRKIITIHYVDKGGETSVRDVEPYEIKGDKFYGYCITKCSIRAFNIGNIRSVSITDKAYNPRWDVKL